MPIYNLNTPGQHDGTNTKVTFGGPYRIYVGLNGQTLERREVKKGDDLHISIEPVGETDGGDDE